MEWENLYRMLIFIFCLFLLLLLQKANERISSRLDISNRFIYTLVCQLFRLDIFFWLYASKLLKYFRDRLIGN